MTPIKPKTIVIYNLERLLSDLTIVYEQTKKGDDTEIDSESLRPILIQNRKRYISRDEFKMRDKG